MCNKASNWMSSGESILQHHIQDRQGVPQGSKPTICSLELSDSLFNVLMHFGDLCLNMNMLFATYLRNKHIHVIS